MELVLQNGVLTLQVNAVCTVALAAAMLLIGKFLKSRWAILQKFCLPVPVVGGFVAMLLVTVCHLTGFMEFTFDKILQDFFMMGFFTAVGLGVNLNAFQSGVNKGGTLLLKYWFVSGTISLCQNLLSLLLGTLLHLAPAYALLAGAISMVGGHGAAGAYGSTFVSMGYPAGLEVGTTAATLGLMFAVIVGAPVGTALVKRYHLQPDPLQQNIMPRKSAYGVENNTYRKELTQNEIFLNITVLLLCMGLGTLLSERVSILLHMKFPAYLGGMLMGVMARTLNDRFRWYRYGSQIISYTGDIMLNLYLAIVLMSLQVWILTGILGSVFLIVSSQAVFMVLISYFVVFRALGSNYDAAVMCAGLCGHGLGAMPSALVNMNVLKHKYGMSQKAFMIVPVVGSCLLDIVYQPHTLLLIKLFVKRLT